MTELEKKILVTLAKALPDLTVLQKEKLLSYGEGIAFKTNQLQNQNVS